MIVGVPSHVDSFCARFAGVLSEAKRTALARILAAFLLVGGKRTHSAVAREVVAHTLAPSSVSRRMRRRSFGTRDLVRAEMNRQIREELARAAGKHDDWFLCLDGVATTRGARSSVENAITYRKKRHGAKGRSTKAHLFVQGLLITPSGRRIPLPRRTYYTQRYVNRENRLRKEGRRKGKPLVHKTQVDLACLVVEELELPENIRLIVLADEYFEGRKLTELCRRKKHVFIAPVDSRRTYAPGRALHARGKSLPAEDRRTLVLRRGREDTASCRRVAPRGARAEDLRVYRYKSERRTVAKIGEVAVVYSWKERTDDAGRPTGKRSYKVLVCSDPGVEAERIIEWFEIRWQVEVFFRELKSDLGLTDYRGTDFSACERHYDLALLAFMSLETLRCEEVAATKSPVKRREIAAMRSSGLRRLLARRALAEDVRRVAGLVRGSKDPEKIAGCLPELRAFKKTG